VELEADLIPTCRPFDTFGLMGRSPGELLQLLLASGVPQAEEVVATFTVQGGDQDTEKTKLPRKILYPTDWFPHANASQQRMVEDFIVALEKLLTVSPTKISLAEEWKRHGPQEAKGKTVNEYLATVG
jgi:hypothetical protein